MTSKKDEPGGLLHGEKEAKPPQTEHRDDPAGKDPPFNPAEASDPRGQAGDAGDPAGRNEPLGEDGGGLTGSSSSRRAGEAETKPAEPIRLDVGPVDEPEGDEDIAAQRELIDEVLSEGATIVASDGELEIPQFGRLSVGGEGWIQHQGKKLYEPKVYLKPGDVRGALVVQGFGLLDKDDVQIAWSPLPEPITVQPNTEVAIVRSIMF